MFTYTAIATHALVHFTVDDTICIIPVGKIRHPPIDQLNHGVSCTVQWTSTDVYDGMIVCVGKAINNY